LSTKEKSVHDGHRDRLRQRYRQNGIDGFSDHELLELILGYVHKRKDTNPIGHALIERFGDLRGVLNADPQDLTQVEDVGEYCAFLLNFLPGIANRYFEQSGNRDLRLYDSARAVDFFARRFVGCKVECLFAAFLDENYDLIYCEKQYEGSINAVEIHDRRIIKAAQRCGCSRVIIAHNHFTDAIPSVPDLNATRSLSAKLKNVGIELYDHIIVCGSGGTSMRESGHISKII